MVGYRKAGQEMLLKTRGLSPETGAGACEASKGEVIRLLSRTDRCERSLHARHLLGGVSTVPHLLPQH